MELKKTTGIHSHRICISFRMIKNDHNTYYLCTTNETKWTRRIESFRWANKTSFFLKEKKNEIKIKSLNIVYKRPNRVILGFNSNYTMYVEKICAHWMKNTSDTGKNDDFLNLEEFITLSLAANVPWNAFDICAFYSHLRSTTNLSSVPWRLCLSLIKELSQNVHH